MARSTNVRAADVMKSTAVLGECLALGADRDAWPVRLMHGIRGLIGARVVIAGEMAGIGPDQPRRSLAMFRLGWPSEEAERRWTEYARAAPVEQKPEYPVICRMLAGTGGRGITLTRDAIWGGPAVWERSRAFNTVHRVCGIDDYIFSIRRLPRTGTMSSIWAHRGVGENPFGPRERRLLSLLHDQVAVLAGGALASGGEPALSALPPRPRRVLDLLLTGMSEQDAANELGLSKATVHEHARRVYTHFGVTSRAGLLSRFIGRAAPVPTPQG